MYIIDKYVEYLEVHPKMNKDKINRIKYAAESLINDISKLSMYIVLGFCIGRGTFVLGFLLGFLALRLILGGVHRKTYWGCFFYTLFMIVIGVLISETWIKYRTIIEMLTFILCCTGTVAGPIVSRYKKPQSDSMKSKKRIMAIYFQSLFFIIYIFCRKEDFGYGLLIGLLFEQVQVIYLSMKSKIQEEKNNGRVVT